MGLKQQARLLRRVERLAEIEAAEDVSAVAFEFYRTRYRCAFGRAQRPDEMLDRQASRRRDLMKRTDLRDAIQARDGDRCRYCLDAVRWDDRRSPKGATYDHVDPEIGNTLANVVIACRHCNLSKGSRTPEQAGIKLHDLATDLTPDLTPVLTPESDQSRKGSDSGRKTPSSSFLKFYSEQFEQAFKDTPSINYAKDGAISKRLLKQYGEEKLRGLLEDFFKSDDEFIQKSGHTMGVFASVLNKLLVAKRNGHHGQPRSFSERLWDEAQAEKRGKP